MTDSGVSREDALAAAVESLSEGLAVLDDAGRFLEVNPVHADIYGFDDPEVLVGEHWSSLYADEDVETLTEAVGTLDPGETWRGDATGRRADGSTFAQELTLTRMADGGYVCIVRDVERSRQQERQLSEQKRRIRSIVENVPIVLFAFDETGEVVLSEGKGLATLGLEPGQAVGESVFEMYADVPAVTELARRALEGEHVHDTIPVGNRHFETWFTPVREDGEVRRVIGTAMDVTDRLAQERQLAELHEAIRRLNYAGTHEEVAETGVDIAEEVLEMPVSTLWRYDGGDDCLRPVAMTETSETALEVDDVADLDPITEGELGMEVFREKKLRAIEDYGTVENREFELPLGTVFVVPLGEHGILEVGQRDVRPITENLRRSAAILGVNLQVAFDRVDREALLRDRTEELEVRTSQLDFINSIIRHDVLNGMTVIRARAAFLEESLEGREREFAETILRWCDNIVDFVQRVQTVLDALGGEDAVDIQAVDAVELLDNELQRLRQTYPAVTFETELPESLPVRADPLLADVFGNILTNAIEHNDPAELRITVTARVDDDVTTVRIADNGAGIPPDQRDVVFRRGESHAKSTGSGFGLFFVDAMLEAYGGSVSIEDGDGAVFVLELPTAAHRRETS